MKATVLLFCVVLATVCCDAHGWRPYGWKYTKDFVSGSRDMIRPYNDMIRANYIGADKYFHARGNYDGAKRGTGGRHAAYLLGNGREWFQTASGRGHEDTAADQKANEWGRRGSDSNRFRPKVRTPSPDAHGWRPYGWKYTKDFVGGSRDMLRAYKDMIRANYIGADKYFHARGNYDAAKRGTGGRHAAYLLSNGREWFQTASGRGHEDTVADQKANEWGRRGGDPNRFRPKGLPKEY